MHFKIEGGSFGAGSGMLFDGKFFLPCKTGRRSECVALSRVTSLEIASEQNIKGLAGTLGWGAAGGLALGPVGLLAGLLLGGKRTEVAFIVAFDDDRSFLAIGDHRTFVTIKAAAIEPIKSNQRKHAARLAKTSMQEPSAGSSAPPLTKALDYIEWAFRSGGWKHQEHAKAGGESYTSFEATRGLRSVALVWTPEAVTVASLKPILDVLATTLMNERIIVAKSFGIQEERTAIGAGVTICALTDLRTAIVR